MAGLGPTGTGRTEDAGAQSDAAEPLFPEHDFAQLPIHGTSIPDFHDVLAQPTPPVLRTNTIRSLGSPRLRM